MAWILTREINEYDQDGEYFVSVFKNKPTEADLFANGIPDEETAKHVLGGGGRMGVEHTWWHLREHVPFERIIITPRQQVAGRAG